MRRLTQKMPSPAMVVAVIALLAALSGGAYAASKISGSSLKNSSISSKKLKNAAVTTAKLKNGAVTAAKLVPNLVVNHAQTADSATHANTADSATQANTADSATSASHASSADTATNASQLDGQPGSDYRLHCPGGLDRAADLCFESGERAGADYATALHTCALAQRRLPDDGELALVFGHLASQQDVQWVAGHDFDADPGSPAVAPTLFDDNSYNIKLNEDVATALHPYRCVTSATNSS